MASKSLKYLNFSLSNSFADIFGCGGGTTFGLTGISLNRLNPSSDSDFSFFNASFKISFFMKFEESLLLPPILLSSPKFILKQSSFFKPISEKSEFLASFNELENQNGVTIFCPMMTEIIIEKNF